METEEVIKLVDNIYKNILEKFNPGARQLISTGKAYLKALHGAAAASRLFNESLAKIAINAQQGGTTDIGSALMNIVGVYKEIQDQHMNILKAFYVDLLVPLETNLEKDTKVVQFEQKKFLQLHKVRADSYSKAAATMKKYRKKNKTTQAAAEKEMKSIQALEEEKNKLDGFCEQSLKNAMTQERRRYGFVLERQCSLAKHWMAYHNAGYSTIESNVEHWNDVAATREFLPPNVENMFVKKMRHHLDDDDSDPGSTMSTLRKTRSIDASCLDMRSLGDVANSNNMQMPRAKSEYALNGTNGDSKHWDRPIVKALYAYLSSGENQLSFLEGDRIALVGDRAKGWQFGENLRTQKFGWFPIAYTEIEYDETNSSYWSKTRQNEQELEQMQDLSLESAVIDEVTMKMSASYNEDASPTRMFGDTIQYRNSKQFRRVSRGQIPPKPGPPPTLPAPVPTPVVPESYSKQQQQQQQQQALSQSHSFSSSGGPPLIEKRKTGPSTMNYSKPPTGNKTGKPSRNGATNASLHSSNDSGFSNSNEPPPQPEIDYSDEETLTRVPIRSRSEKNIHEHRDHMSMNYSMNNEEIYGQAPFKQSTLNMRTAASYNNLTTDDRTLDTMYRSNADLSGKNVKRTKSFWKFSKSEDILEGMAMWKHKDLVPTVKEKIADEKREATLKRNLRKKAKQHEQKEVSTSGSPPHINGGSAHIKPRPHSMAIMEEHTTPPPPYQMTKAEIDQRISKHNQSIYDLEKTATLTKPTKSSKSKERGSSNGKPARPYKETEPDEDEIYGDTSTLQRSHESRKEKHRPVSAGNVGDMHAWNGNKMKDYQDSDSTLKRSLDDFSMIINDSMRMQENFYDDESIEDIMMKTVKRKEILKQYYSSGTDTERNSTSSDPYDCIVVDDHLVSAADLMIKNNKENLNRTRKNDKQQMEFSTFRSSEKSGTKEKSSNRESHQRHSSSNNNNNSEREGQTGTLLPRTKLSKTGQTSENGRKYESDADIREKQRLVKQREAMIKQSYGPWYDLWDKTNGIQK